MGVRKSPNQGRGHMLPIVRRSDGNGHAACDLESQSCWFHALASGNEFVTIEDDKTFQLHSGKEPRPQNQARHCRHVAASLIEKDRCFMRAALIVAAAVPLRRLPSVMPAPE